MNEGTLGAFWFAIFLAIGFLVMSIVFLKKGKARGILTLAISIFLFSVGIGIKNTNTPGKIEEVRFERVLYHMGNSYSILVDGKMRREDFGNVVFRYDAKDGEKSWVRIQRNARGGVMYSDFHLHNAQELGAGDYHYKSGKQTKQGSTTVVE